MKNTDITIRRLNAEDLSQLQAISRNTFYNSFAWGNTEVNMNMYMENAFSAEALLEELNNPGSVFYFALSADQVVGYLKLNTGYAQSDLQEKNSLEIARIYVEEAYQGKQIGKQLLDKAIEIARQKNVDFVWLGVWEKNPGAIRFYERNGFVKYLTHPFMLGTDRQTDIVMKRMINQ